MQRQVIGLMVFLLSLALPASAETIYSWTDEDGIRRFSNQQPPEGVENYRTETLAPLSTGARADERRRTNYDRMVDRATTESRNFARQRKAAENARAAEQQQKAAANRQGHIAAQRKQLEKRIDKIRKRGLGPTYTKGMQKAQIEEINRQIKDLESGSGDAEPKTSKSGQSSY